jgi:diaminopimelate epimerase
LLIHPKPVKENMPMEHEIIIADPAGNITAFVFDRVENTEDRALLSKAIVDDPLLKVEQAGFVSPPQTEGGLWRLEMMGGEFCGNAARSFGLFAAREQGLKGRVSIPVSVSGAERPVAVNVDVESGWAEAEIPRPLALESLEYSGAFLPVVVFEGITHLIAPDFAPSKAAAKKIIAALEKKYNPLLPGGRLPAAIGVLFHDTDSLLTTPAVYVRAMDSLVFESSCGSGSAARGVWQSRDLPDGEARLSAVQPGGVIEVRVRKSGGRVDSIHIGGVVTLSRLKKRMGIQSCIYREGEIEPSVRAEEGRSGA